MSLSSNVAVRERGGGSQYCNQNEKVAQNMQRDPVGVLSYVLLLQPRCWSGAPSAAVKSQGSCMKASICKEQSGVIIMVHWSEEFVVALSGFLFSCILRSTWCMECMHTQTACVASSTQATTAVAAPLPSPHYITTAPWSEWG